MEKKEQIEAIDEIIRSKFHSQIAYKMCISKYGVADKAERDIINLRLGIEKKDFEIITTALREYAKNHPNPKCHANEAKDLADMIERQGQEVEE